MHLAIVSLSIEHCFIKR